MSQDALRRFGRADALQSALGLTPETGLGIAAIVSFAGAIEYHLERAIWRMRGVEPRGVRPDTDARMVSDLIAMLEREAATRDGEAGRLLRTWCAAARAGFTVRHNIAHGVPGRIGDTLAYMRNPRWEGEMRKREFGDFWANPHALDLVREAMATLLRIIAALSGDGADPSAIATAAALRAVGDARSVLGEFASQNYNPSFEKY
ncbi:hypothetical protein [Sphingomonas sp. BK345]|uniref:hypothetical protein n=1 Tax=Sphingomonas sp. BK345 TaxID=2586980 RepID=UPI00161DA7DF|nr:hypothetical protein [Sphingomonas sp. BK345]MBB3473485.1 hypothetical protein [Sphingomonas sp. BK345]